MKPSNIQAFIAELGGGVHEEMMCALLSEVATAVIENGVSGELSLKMKISPSKIAHPSGPTVDIKHTVAYKRPKMRGIVSEDDTGETPCHVNIDGTVSLFPKDQDDMINKARKGEANVT